VGSEAAPGGIPTTSPSDADGRTAVALPGEGTFDLVGLVRLLDDMGVEAPLSVEIISAEHAARPVTEAARRAHDAARAVVSRARRR
jgi:sugar phosphate isomerase/epimerase